MTIFHRYYMEVHRNWQSAVSQSRRWIPAAKMLVTLFLFESSRKSWTKLWCPSTFAKTTFFCKCHGFTPGQRSLLFFFKKDTAAIATSAVPGNKDRHFRPAAFLTTFPCRAARACRHPPPGFPFRFTHWQTRTARCRRALSLSLIYELVKICFEQLFSKKRKKEPQRLCPRRVRAHNGLTPAA